MLNTKSILTQDYAEKNPIRATISSAGSIAYNGAGFINDSLKISRKALTLIDVELDAMILERKQEVAESNTTTTNKLEAL